MPEAILSERRRRLPLRMSVRALVIVVLVVGAWLGRVENRARARLRAIESVRKVGGSIVFDDQRANGIAAPAGGSWVPGWLRRGLGDHYFHKVVDINLWRCEKVDGCLAAVDGLDELEGLWLHTTDLSDAGLEHVRGLTGLRVLTLGFGTHETDAGIANLAGLTGLRKLDLRLSNITDAGMVHLAGLTRLEALDLGDTAVGDAGAAHLRGLTGLRELSLYDTRVGNAGVAHLSGLTRLRSLNLDAAYGLKNSGRFRIDDAGLSSLAGLVELRRLDLAGARINGPGLRYLKGMVRLEYLRLWETGVTDAGLEHLRGLTALEALDLFQTRITDAGLMGLRTLPALLSLEISHTRVTEAGIAEFRAARPEVSVRTCLGGRCLICRPGRDGGN